MNYEIIKNGKATLVNDHSYYLSKFSPMISIEMKNLSQEVNTW